MAAGDLTNLATLKLWLPIPANTTSEDATLGRLITATSGDFTRSTNRPDLLTAAYAAEVHTGDGGRRMIAFHWPITAVTTLTVGGAAVAASADKVAPGYYFDLDIDQERNRYLYLNGSTFTDGAPVVLNYNAGYAMTPGDIEQAVIDWIVYRYKGRPNVGANQRRTAEGESVSVEQVDAPPNVLQVIERYTRRFPQVNRRYDEMEMMHAQAKAGVLRRPR
jgi:hypothetical protein